MLLHPSVIPPQPHLGGTLTLASESADLLTLYRKTAALHKINKQPSGMHDNIGTLSVFADEGFTVNIGMFSIPEVVVRSFLILSSEYVYFKKH